ncbi:MAG: hypothetical protein HKN74_10020 [Acidimicrobiia bacterium]|nr:hypothetical protein [Acidimicrobiia bacterium]NNF10609.1 hypothetical protein [Acidimicrobiia bacterium]NNL69524.1 hypothetical protein [Acidimicrobiia bacterium]
MSTLSYEGVTVELPPGWDGAIRRMPIPARDLSVGAEAETGESHVVVHAANFPLPPERGDFGSGAVEIMRSQHLLMVIFDYGPDAAGTALFRYEGIPVPLDPETFDPNMMQRPLPLQSGLQRFFTVNGRGYCLYVALGSHRNRHALVEQANEVLRTLDLDGNPVDRGVPTPP